jgi:hypothetical protein
VSEVRSPNAHSERPSAPDSSGVERSSSDVLQAPVIG